MDINEARMLLDFSNCVDDNGNRIYSIKIDGSHNDDTIYLGEANPSGFSISYYDPCISRSNNLLDYKLEDFIVSKVIDIKSLKNYSKLCKSLSPVAKLVKNRVYRLKTLEELKSIYTINEDGSLVNSDGKIVLSKYNFWRCGSLIKYGSGPFSDYETASQRSMGGKVGLYRYEPLPDMVWGIHPLYDI